MAAAAAVDVTFTHAAARGYCVPSSTALAASLSDGPALAPVALSLRPGEVHSALFTAACAGGAYGPTLALVPAAATLTTQGHAIALPDATRGLKLDPSVRRIEARGRGRGRATAATRPEGTPL